jgi:hypothetical protein
MTHTKKLRALKSFMYNGNRLKKGDTFQPRNADLVEYYLRNDYASKVNTAETKEDGAEFSQELTPTLNKDLTVKELKQIAKAKGLEGYTKMSKAELLQNLS